MTLSLNHVSIRSADLAACERFYCGLLGLAVGPRPPFPFPGLWLYAGDTAQYSNAAVHIIGYGANDPEGLKRYLTLGPAGEVAISNISIDPNTMTVQFRFNQP